MEMKREPICEDTLEFVQEYYRLNTEPLFSVLADDCVWMGMRSLSMRLSSGLRSVSGRKKADGSFTICTFPTSGTSRWKKKSSPSGSARRLTIPSDVLRPWFFHGRDAPLFYFGKIISKENNLWPTKEP